MKQQHTAKAWLFSWLSALVLIFCTCPTILKAQGANQYILSGTITDSGSGEELLGATVRIDGSGAGAISDIDGTYVLTTLLPAGNYSLIVSYVGYSSQTLPISLGSDTEVQNNFTLQADPLSLDEIVITGSAVATRKKELGNAISTVQAEDLENNAAIAVDQALSGKIAGAMVMQNSGDPAGGISIRLRGPSTITGSSDPLYIIDGVIVNNDSRQIVDIGGTSQNRLVDINPSDIESIEVIKGAAAAAIYGSRASNGVVQIFTKRGKEGKAKVRFTTGVKLNELRKEIDYNTAPLAWEDPFDNNNLATVPAQRFNFQDEFFDSGIGTENNLSISGGNQETTYYFSGSYLDNPGIIKNSNFERYGAKLNLDQKLNKWLSLTAGLNYNQSKSEDIPNGGISAAYGAITGFTFSDNSIDPSPNSSGVYPVTSLLVPRTNPLEAVNRFQFGQRTNRVITSIGAKAFPTDELGISYTFGLDSYNQSGNGFVPVENTSTNPTGLATRAEANVFQYNSDLNVSYITDLTDNVTSNSVIGGTWQGNRTEGLGLTSDRLAPTVQVASGGTVIGQFDSRSEVSYWGAFAQQRFGFRDKLFVTGALRLDGASVFGEDERNQLYAKASTSYVISDEDFWSDALRNSISSLKLRASWGQSGNLTALGAFDRFSNYNAIAFNGTSGVIPSNLQGNEALKPERQEELEFGFDASFLDSRIGLEFTYYKQDVDDLLLQRELSPSSGFGTRFENIGALENKGIELLLTGSPVNKSNLRWDASVTYSKNKNEVTRVVGDRITLPGSFATSYVIPGEPLGVFFRAFYDRDANGNIIFDSDGYPSAGTNPDGSRAKIIGDPNPEWFGSFVNEITVNDFALRFQFDAVQGFDVFNWNRRLLDNKIFGGGANAGEELLGNLPKGLGGVQAGIFEEFVEDGSFVKLRELALSYNYAPPTAAISNIRLSLIGRNLVSFDDYSGWDPEINTTGQSNGVRGFDFAGVPIPRSYMLNATFDF